MPNCGYSEHGDRNNIDSSPVLLSQRSIICRSTPVPDNRGARHSAQLWDKVTEQCHSISSAGVGTASREETGSRQVLQWDWHARALVEYTLAGPVPKDQVLITATEMIPLKLGDSIETTLPEDNEEFVDAIMGAGFRGVALVTGISASAAPSRRRTPAASRVNVNEVIQAPPALQPAMDGTAATKSLSIPAEQFQNHKDSAIQTIGRVFLGYMCCSSQSNEHRNVAPSAQNHPQSKLSVESLVPCMSIAVSVLMDIEDIRGNFDLLDSILDDGKRWAIRESHEYKLEEIVSPLILVMLMDIVKNGTMYSTLPRTKGEGREYLYTPKQTLGVGTYIVNEGHNFVQQETMFVTDRLVEMYRLCDHLFGYDLKNQIMNLILKQYNQKYFPNIIQTQGTPLKEPASPVVPLYNARHIFEEITFSEHSALHRMIIDFLYHAFTGGKDGSWKRACVRKHLIMSLHMC